MKLSVIIPVFNEEANLRALIEKLEGSLEQIGDYEVIFVDDGSSDRSVEILRESKKQDDRIRIIRLSRNFGQHAAIAAGFDNSKGELVVTMDADLQNDPADIPAIYEKHLEGYDYISGWRKKRHDPFFSRKLPSKFINIFTSWLTGVHLHDYHCGLKGFSRGIVDQMSDFTEMRRCFPALAAKLCRKPVEIEVMHHEREGKSKYNLWGLARNYFDFYVSFSVRPFQVLAVFGGILFVLSLVVSAAYIASRIIGWIGPTPQVLYVLIFTGINSLQLIIFGILGEYLMRIYKMIQDRSLYKIETIE